MGQSLARVKHRIGSVESTRKITNSMKLVSSVKLRKIAKIINQQSDFYNALIKLLNDALYSLENNPESDLDLSLIKENKNTNKKLFVVVTSNMGLCGGYNNNLIDYLTDFYKSTDEILIIGSKGENIISKDKSVVMNNRFSNLREDFSHSKIDELIAYLIDVYKKEEYKEINLVYTKYKNSISFIPSIKKILPIDVSFKKQSGYSPIFEPSIDSVLNSLIPLYLKTVLYNDIYSSFLCEESSRRNTMDNADKNAVDLIDKLKLEYNKARQSAITQEITEVVNGANALK